MELHLFDFDGTLTRKDTLFEFTRFCHSRMRYYTGLLILSPVLAATRMGLVKGDQAKAVFLGYFFKKKDKALLEECGRRFFHERLPALLRSKGIETIRKLKNEKHEVAVVSASLDIWLKPFAERYELKLLCTLAEYDEQDKFTGRFKGKNCNNREKSVRVLNTFDLKKYSCVIAYGDTKSDKHLFDMSTHYHFRPFHRS